MDATEAASRWRGVLDRASVGEVVVVQRRGRPVAAVISLGDYMVVREQLEGMADLRRAEGVLREIERDPSRLIPVEELDAEMEGDDGGRVFARGSRP